MAERSFDDVIVAEAYEAMIDWPRRLANETPFYRWIFDRIGAKRVLDAACGAGHHAAMFHQWGLEVEAADVSAAMIARARSAHGEPANLRWVVRGFDQPAAAPEAFDVAVCVGNSLALAADESVAGPAVEAMLGAVRSGGAVVIQLLNLWRLCDGPVTWQKCLRRRLGDQEMMIIKGVHRAGRLGFVDMILVSLDSDVPRLHAPTSRLLGLDIEQLRQWVGNGGAGDCQAFGGYDRAAYDPASSADLILVAQKR